MVFIRFVVEWRMSIKFFLLLQLAPPNALGGGWRIPADDNKHHIRHNPLLANGGGNSITDKHLAYIRQNSQK